MRRAFAAMLLAVGAGLMGMGAQAHGAVWEVLVGAVCLGLVPGLIISEAVAKIREIHGTPRP